MYLILWTIYTEDNCYISVPTHVYIQSTPPLIEYSSRLEWIHCSVALTLTAFLIH